ncbi:outer membrane biogenesis protein BamB [Posidoniimonas polymericola]|uniref:Outer membrane biogenesis protein BamB n=1 Tax=Posidoniimonas polymericola TaxID=2528002 RepID=A0A5C5XUZ4_9BACT|nr:PQQ-binding-like beta-propeller repeat protein [Posidoniimonas polymericola]TWT65412.1 outer membrane biogenesis protein BamB [Posidoniimonas polymericola]
MAAANPNPLRVWPAVLLVVVMWASIIVPTSLVPFGMATMWSLMVGLGGGTVGYLVWWLLASRVPWPDRVSGLLLLAALLLVGTQFLFHPTASQPMPLLTMLIPCLLSATTFGFLLSKPLPWNAARWVALAWLIMTVVVWSGVRVDGSDGTLALQLSWRGLPTAEEIFLAQRRYNRQENRSDDAATPGTDQQVSLSPGDWPAFRGPDQDSVFHGAAFPTDWGLHAPRQLWRRRVGPGWSSFAVIGDRVYTQEQRGELEATVCYNGNTGDEAWSATTPARFYKVESGPGPLATPSFSAGAVYSCGAAGAVTRMDAATGAVAWQRSLTDDLPRDAPPEWGFASSPLIVPHGESALVVVYAGNPPGDADPTGQAVVAYDSETGEPVWTAGVGDHSYCTPMLVELHGAPQLLCTSNAGLESLAPATGERLWFYEWSTGEFPRIAQPVVVDEQTLVLASGYGYGAHGIRVAHDEGRWSTETLWQSRVLRPYFNDFLLHDGYLYGFDDKFFTCVNASTGELAWPKRTRRQTQFGCGQVVLAEKSDALLVMTEHTGELVLMAPSPEGPRELSRMQVLEGKTWNHPVLAHGRLFVRNGVEMACYELPAVEIAATRTRTAELE